MTEDERDFTDADALDEPEPSTDDVDAEMTSGGDDPWFDAESGGDGG